MKIKYLRWLPLTLLMSCLLGCSEQDGGLQGYVEGRYTYASAYTSGYLSNLLVSRGQGVKANQPLFILSSQPEQDAYNQAQAELLSQQQTYQDMLRGKRLPDLQSIGAQIRAAKATKVYAKQTLSRNESLYEQHAIGKAVLDQSKANYLSAQAAVNQYQADLARAKLGARTNQQLAQKAKVMASKAAAKKTKWLLSTKDFKAPKAGRIDETFYREGEFVPAGQPVLSMLVPTEVKIIFYIPEPTLGSLSVGQAIHFTCDGCKPSTARIDYIASQAEYTPPVLYTQSARKNLVFRVEAAIPVAVALSYHPGQPVDITLPVKHSSKR